MKVNAAHHLLCKVHSRPVRNLELDIRIVNHHYDVRAVALGAPLYPDLRRHYDVIELQLRACEQEATALPILHTPPTAAEKARRKALKRATILFAGPKKA